MRDSADYMRIIRPPDSASTLYNVFEYYINGKQKLVGKSTTINPPRFEEQCATFYKNGVRQSITKYKNGQPIGNQYKFYPNGKPYLVKEYPDNDSPFNEINSNFLIKECFDSLGTVLIKDGNGIYKGYDDDFKNVNEAGSVKNGKKDGLWKGNVKHNEISYIETYENGNLVTGTATFEDGKITTYTKAQGIVPQFDGGVDAFGKFLGQNIHYPLDARRNNIQGTVILSFIVEKDGRVAHVIVSKSVSQSLDDEAVRVLKKSPLWIPGMQFGRAIRVSYSVPVNFTLRN